MDLTDLMRRHPKVRRADSCDDERICEFFNSKAIVTGMYALQYLRQPSFFSLLRARGVEADVWIYEDEGKVKGVGSVSYRSGFVECRLTRIGYLADLRIARDRAASRGWRDFYKDYLEFAYQDRLESGAEYFYTSVMDENFRAKNALVRGGNRGFQYWPLRRYRMINLWLKKPTAKPKDSLSISQAELEDLPAIAEFLQSQSQQRPFGWNYNLEELRRRMRDWPNLDIRDAMIVRGSSKEILGFTWFWNPSGCKQTRIEIRSGLLGLATRFAPRLPTSEGIIDFLYMTMFATREDLGEQVRQQVVHSLISYGYNLIRDRGISFLSFCQMREDSLAGVLSDYWHFSSPMTLYTVGLNSQRPLVDSQTHDPDFEMAMV